jgi:hypothetical protein
MSIRFTITCLALAGALAACDKSDKSESAETKPEQKGSSEPKKDAAAEETEKMARRCEALGKACGDKDKHQAKVLEECKEAAKQQIDKRCTDKAIAAYDCYEKEICSGLGKVWAMDDFRVLTARHGKCVAERTAAVECLAINPTEK